MSAPTTGAPWTGRAPLFRFCQQDPTSINARWQCVEVAGPLDSQADLDRADLELVEAGFNLGGAVVDSGPLSESERAGLALLLTLPSARLTPAESERQGDLLARCPRLTVPGYDLDEAVTRVHVVLAADAAGLSVEDLAQLKPIATYAHDAARIAREIESLKDAILAAERARGVTLRVCHSGGPERTGYHLEFGLAEPDARDPNLCSLMARRGEAVCEAARIPYFRDGGHAKCQADQLARDLGSPVVSAQRIGGGHDLLVPQVSSAEGIDLAALARAAAESFPVVWADFSPLNRRARSRGAQFRLLGGRHKSHDPVSNPTARKSLASGHELPSPITSAMLATARAQLAQEQADREASQAAKAARVRSAREVNAKALEREDAQAHKAREKGDLYVPSFTAEEVAARVVVEIDALTFAGAAEVLGVPAEWIPAEAGQRSPCPLCGDLERGGARGRFLHYASGAWLLNCSHDGAALKGWGVESFANTILRARGEGLSFPDWLAAHLDLPAAPGAVYPEERARIVPDGEPERLLRAHLAPMFRDAAHADGAPVLLMAPPAGSGKTWAAKKVLVELLGRHPRTPRAEGGRALPVVFAAQRHEQRGELFEDLAGPGGIIENQGGNVLEVKHDLEGLPYKLTWLPEPSRPEEVRTAIAFPRFKCDPRIEALKPGQAAEVERRRERRSEAGDSLRATCKGCPLLREQGVEEPAGGWCRHHAQVAEVQRAATVQTGGADLVVLTHARASRQPFPARLTVWDEDPTPAFFELQAFTASDLTNAGHRIEALAGYVEDRARQGEEVRHAETLPAFEAAIEALAGVHSAPRKGYRVELARPESLSLSDARAASEAAAAVEGLSSRIGVRGAGEARWLAVTAAANEVLASEKRGARRDLGRIRAELSANVERFGPEVKRGRNPFRALAGVLHSWAAGEVALVQDEPEGTAPRALHVRRHHKPLAGPLVVLDASGDAGALSALLGRPVVRERLLEATRAAEWGSLRIAHVVEQCSRTKLRGRGGAEALQRAATLGVHYANGLAPGSLTGSVGVISFKGSEADAGRAVSDAVKSQTGRPPRAVNAARYHGALTGANDLGDVEALIVLGMPACPLAHLRALALHLHGATEADLADRPASRKVRHAGDEEGSARGLWAYPVGSAMDRAWRQTVAAGLEQALGRGHRGASPARAIVVVSATPLPYPLPIERYGPEDLLPPSLSDPTCARLARAMLEVERARETGTAPSLRQLAKALGVGERAAGSVLLAVQGIEAPRALANSALHLAVEVQRARAVFEHEAALVQLEDLVTSLGVEGVADQLGVAPSTVFRWRKGEVMGDLIEVLRDANRAGTDKESRVRPCTMENSKPLPPKELRRSGALHPVIDRQGSAAEVRAAFGSQNPADLGHLDRLDLLEGIQTLMGLEKVSAAAELSVRTMRRYLAGGSPIPDDLTAALIQLFLDLLDPVAVFEFVQVAWESAAGLSLRGQLLFLALSSLPLGPSLDPLPEPWHRRRGNAPMLYPNPAAFMSPRALFTGVA